MGDMGDYFRDVDAFFSQRRDKNHMDNLEALDHFKIPFRDVGNSTVLIRIEGVPKIDFYISRNKWKVSEGKRPRFINGDTKSFINWFMKRYAKKLEDQANER